MLARPTPIAGPAIALNPSARARARRIAQIVVAVLIVAAVLALALDSSLARYHGNLAGLIQFGKQFAGQTHPPAGAPITSSQGYDGQFIYVQALDPLLLHNATVNSLVPTLGDVWSDTRLSVPLFALLLVDGLQRGDRLSVLISTAAAAMSILVPIAIPGVF